GNGTALGAQPGATGKLADAGKGHGLGGAERLTEGGKDGHGRGVGSAEGDAPLAAGDLGKMAGPKGPGAGEGRKEPVGGEGREHAAGAGLGTLGQGKGAGGDALAALGGSGSGGTKLCANGASGSPAKGFELDPYTPGIPSRTRLSGRGMGTAGERPIWGPATGHMLRVTLGLARHAGDWNSSPTALYHLATAFMERSGLPDVKAEVKNVALSDPEALAACRVVLITSNDPIAFTPAERAGLRAYLDKGGLVWVNDSSASGDERFDTAFRRDLETVAPGARLLKMDRSEAFFRSAYDLSRGYKGYRIPPGDKYREEFVESLTVGNAARPALIYTRNDYADGLEIDPRNIAGRASLTDLTPEEMLEGSLRFGINLVAFSLGAEAPRLPPPPESSAQAAKLYRYSGPDLPVFDAFEPGADGVSEWNAEEWGNPTQAEHVNLDRGRALKVTFKSGEKSKAAVTRSVDVDLSDAKALVLDLHSSLAHGFNVAVLFQTRPDWDGYECRPVFVRPGWNKNLRFPLNLDDFKSSKSEWKAYDRPFAPRTQVARITILLYNHESDGAAILDNLRVER
ncbi:MAG: DUF4159 domain-containing protein, partial [Planctomycetota bacterium]|nr:DUF4159 domain-containing protein [Planctomycetota bacterium]